MGELLGGNKSLNNVKLREQMKLNDEVQLRVKEYMKSRDVIGCWSGVKPRKNVKVCAGDGVGRLQESD